MILMLLFQLLGLLFYAVQEGNLYRGDVISVKAFVFLVFGFGLLFSQGVTYAACVLQYLTVRHLEVVVQTGNPVFHEHGLSAKRLQFRKIQIFVYRAMVDKAAAIAEQQKSRVDPMYHEKIDHLLDTYARKLAENMNQGFAIDARVPSVMIAGPANFPVGKKEKQNRARDSNMEEWRYIQGLLDKIRSTGMGGISADDPAAIEKLQKKLDGLERSQLIMKEVNAYYRKHGKLDGCALLSPDQIEKLKASMASSWRSDPRPFESYQLTNNNAEIRRVKTRIEQLSKQAQREFSGWEFDGGRVEMNREDNRLQVFFDGKPDADTRAELKSSGFRWAPSVGAWQRQLTDNAIRAADRLECIKPLSGEKPSQLQKKPSILQTMREQGEKVQTEPEKKAPSGRDAER